MLSRRAQPDVVANQDEEGSASPYPSQRLNAFISYSRNDMKFVDQLDHALRACGLATLIDRKSVSSSEDWKERLGFLIRSSDAVVFVLTRSSTESQTCRWELLQAEREGKRVFPIVPKSLAGELIPQEFADLHYVHFYEEERVSGSGFGHGLALLVEGINEDRGWLQDHTRFQRLAVAWEKSGREVSRLLSAVDVSAAKAWIAHQPRRAPDPTPLQLDFFKVSEDRAVEETDLRQKTITERERQIETKEAALKKSKLRLILFGFIFALAGLAFSCLIYLAR